MHVIYALERIPPSMFLAGPTPREDHPVPSWRPEALKILEELGYDGSVCVPESRDGKFEWEYDSQINWETAGLMSAGVIVFWVPRDPVALPAFTTNIEFGMHLASRKILLGWPEDAYKMSFFKKKAEEYNIPVFHDLRALLNRAVTQQRTQY
jgi:hypothetical protein